MGEFEAIGETVTGGLLARAVEPKAGEAGPDGHTHETSCLNCRTPLTGPYCASCGQKSHIHRSLRGFFQDLVQGLFNFEGKIWRTLPMLAWCPGDLTRRYIAGERARFISPIALYLFTVFAMFAVLSLTGTINTNPAVVKSGIETAVREEQAELVRLEAERKTAAAQGQDLAALNQRIAEAKDGLAQLDRVGKGEFIRTDLGEGAESPAWVKDLVERGKDNPQQLATGIQDAASKYSWLLIPISVPFLWLLFPFRRQYHLYDHAVFVTYSLSFMMMLVIVGGLLVAGGMAALAGFLFFVPPFHMYRQLKGAYQLGRISAFLRTIALMSFAFVAAGLFIAAAVAIGTM